ncbi:hypothetical protein OsI_31390 [Oryza sativa Indica Group]|uniref:RBR-type E3 ubiquitin transferase n=1 Tax=Oryza sativa subsp. indica TaxID=39946 RepID=A2Z1B1_ORYSI|nr:hypothetical protein OsI_31390 [Oryza sativa Indica Group]
MNIDDALAEELQLQEAILFSAFQEMIIQDTDDDDSIGNLILIGQDQGQESKKPFSVADHGESSSPSPLTMTTTTGGGGAGEFYCSICMETVPGALKFSVSPCLHAFCVCCISQYVAAKIGENTADVRCPDPGCGGGVEPESCRGVVPSEVLDRWGLLLCEAAIVARRLHCPFRDCSEPLLADADGEGGGVAEAECPSCHRLFCARCMVPWHDGVGCEEFQELGEDERGREDVMVRRLAGRERWQRCPQCRMYVEKSEGCMFMKCRAAGEGPPDMSANVDLDAKRLVPLKAWGRCRGCWSSSSSYPRSKMVWQWRRLRSSSASFSKSLGKLLRVTGEAEGVRHVPGLKRNLILLETLHEEGLIFRGNRNRKTMEIMKGKTTVMTGENVESHLYKLRGCTVAGGVQEGAVARIAIVFGGGGSGAYSSGGLR